VQENLVARQEKRLLAWMCARMPAWVTPDQLTLLALFGALMIGAGYALSFYGLGWLWLSIAGYVVHWVGDSTDGSLARYRGIERPRYGYFLDHSCDGLALVMMAAGAAMGPFFRVDAVFIALAGYLLLAVHAFLSVKVLGELKLSHAGAGPTEARLILIALTFVMMALGPDAGRGLVAGYSGYDIFVAVAGVILIAIFAVQTFLTARRLGREEPPRNHEWTARERT
jgi:phosphatidylglycerophosphate synthase